MAIRCLRRRVEVFELKMPVVDRFIADDVLQIIAKNVRSQHTDDNGRIGFGKGFRRPFYEFGEVEQERCFELIFGGRTLRQTVESETDKHAEQQNHRPEMLTRFRDCFPWTARKSLPGFTVETG